MHEDQLFVIRFQPIVQPDPDVRTHAVRSADFPPEGISLTQKIVERIQAWGYKNIVLSGYKTVAPWVTTTEKEDSYQRAEDFAKQVGITLRWFPGEHEVGKTDQKAYAAFLLEILRENKASSEIVLNSESLFVPRARVEAMIESINSGSDQYLKGGSASWEHINAVKPQWYETFLEKGAYPEVSANAKRYANIEASTFPKFAKFRFTAEFQGILNALAENPVDQWNYEVLSTLWSDHPELFYSVLHHVGVEVTNDDNLANRIRSPRKISTRDIGYLNRENWDSVCAALNHQLAAVSIDIYDFGEPLLHKEIVDFIEHSSKLGIRTDLYTNGTLLDEAMSQKLVESGLDAIFVRIDAMTENVSATVNGDSDSFKLSQKNLQTFLNIKAKRGNKNNLPWKPITAVQITEMADTSADFESFMDEYDFKGKTSADHPNLVEPEIFKQLYLNYQPLEYAMIRHDNLMRGKVTRQGGMDVTPLHRFNCRQIKDGPYVLWNGDIVACREDYDAEFTWGNISDSLSNAIKSDEAGNTLKTQSQKMWDKNPLCKDCKEWFYNFR
ncbi:MAG: SPASM domain-containing protein [Candidatus Lindowbacteria bacterium]|nr:SPASM domain-containing protein [Candidatus Lindowbacteria bacterium]